MIKMVVRSDKIASRNRDVKVYFIIIVRVNELFNKKMSIFKEDIC